MIGLALTVVLWAIPRSVLARFLRPAIAAWDFLLILFPDPHGGGPGVRYGENPTTDRDGGKALGRIPGLVASPETRSQPAGLGTSHGAQGSISHSEDAPAWWRALVTGRRSLASLPGHSSDFGVAAPFSAPADSSSSSAAAAPGGGGRRGF